MEEQHGGSYRGIPVTLQELKLQDEARADWHETEKSKRRGAFVTRPHKNAKRRFGRKR